MRQHFFKHGQNLSGLLDPKDVFRLPDAYSCAFGVIVVGSAW
jgi:hypothetical protein